MSAARLDPFSARLHAIHLKGARAKPSELTPQEEKAPPVASTGMPGSMSLSAADDEGPGSMSLSAADDEGPGSMSLSVVDDEEEARSEYPDDDDGAPKGYQAQIHGLRRRVEELESEMRSLSTVVDQLTRPAAQKWSLGAEDE
jgi:hypothetical protein